MATKKVLVTGGAGFIGSHLVDALVKEGHEVTVFDCLDKQVHEGGKKPSYLNKKAKFVKGDVRDAKALKRVLRDQEVVYHEAAAVGVGQSMYQIKHYMDVNTLGTAQLLDLLVNNEHDVKKLIVAASMSSYGEGLYECNAGCGLVEPELRGEEQLKNGFWDVLCPSCGKELRPLPTPESKHQKSNSIYALSKEDQERMVLMVGKTYGLPSVALRYFNVFGPRQSLSNPYTGVAAIFMSRVKNGHAPVVYEDGLQTRDFVSVHDIVSANLAAMKSKNADYEIFNVGNGKPLPIVEIAETAIKLFGAKLKPEVTRKYRKGDVRHCYADTRKIEEKLDWRPRVSFEEGMQELIGWSQGVKAVDRFEQAAKELKDKGLV